MAEATMPIDEQTLDISRSEQVRQNFADARMARAEAGRVSREQRQEVRAIRDEVDKDKFLRDVDSVASNPDEFRLSNQARMERQYGNGNVGFWGRVLGGGGSTFARRVMGKTAVQAGVSLGVTAAVGGLSATTLAPVFAGIGISVGGGLVGRGIYEAYRAISGKERKLQEKLDKANQAVSDRIVELSDRANELMMANPEGIEENPEYKKLVFELADLMYDDGSRKVKVERDSDGNERYVAVGKDQIGDGIINVNETAKQLFEMKKRAERTSDIFAAVGSVGTGVALQALFGQKLAEYLGQQAAHKAGESIIQNQGAGIEAIKQAKDLGAFDFDKMAIPDSSFDHFIRMAQNGAMEFWNNATGAWHDIGSNFQGVLAAIAKNKTAEYGMDFVKGVIGVGAGSLATIFSRRFDAKAEGEELGRGQSERIRRLFGDGGAGGEGSGGNGNENEDIPDGYIPSGHYINIFQDKDFRKQIGLHASYDRATHFYIERYDGDTAILVPIDYQRGTLIEGGKPRIQASFLDMTDADNTRNIMDMGVYGSPGAQGEGGGVVPTGPSGPGPEVPGQPGGERTPEQEEADKNIEFTRKMAEITLSRVKNFEELNAENEEAGNEKFKNATKKYWAKDITVHWISESNNKSTDLDGRSFIGILKEAGIPIKNNEIHYVPKGQFEEGRITGDSGNQEGVVINAFQFDPEKGTYTVNPTAMIDHHNPVLSGREYCAARYAYEGMIALGMIERKDYLDKLFVFVSQMDNMNFPNQDAYFENSAHNMIGLSKFIRFETLLQMFKDGVEPTDYLDDGTLKKYRLKELSERTEKSRKKSIEALDLMDENGFILDTGSSFGRVAIDVGGMVPSNVAAAYYYDCDTYLKWKPETNSFFISSKETFPADFNLPEGLKVRGTMWVKPEDPNSKPLTVTLDDILKAMTEGNYAPSLELRRYMRDGTLPEPLTKLIEERRGEGASSEEESIVVEEAEEPAPEEVAVEEESEVAKFFEPGAAWKSLKNGRMLIKEVVDDKISDKYDRYQWIRLGNLPRDITIKSAFEENELDNKAIRITFDEAGGQPRDLIVEPKSFLRAAKPVDVIGKDQDEKDRLRSETIACVRKKMGDSEGGGGTRTPRVEPTPPAPTTGVSPEADVAGEGDAERDVELENKVKEIYEKAGNRSESEVQALIDEAVDLLLKERGDGAGKLKPTIPEMKGSESFVDGDVVYLKGDCEAIFIGDTHGDPLAVRSILNQVDFFGKVSRGEKIKVIMLGDYADRGSADLENVEQVLDLMLKFPDNIVLLSGNHEETIVSMKYGFLESLSKKYGEEKGRELFAKYIQMYEQMPTSVVTENGVLAMHGGIGKFENLTDMQGQRKTVHWADPQRGSGSGIVPNRSRVRNESEMDDESIIKSGLVLYGRDALESYLDKIGAKTLVRAHEANPGIYWDGKLATVFSTGAGSPNSYYDAEVQKPAFLTIDLKKPMDGLDLKEYDKNDNYKFIDYSKGESLPEIKNPLEGEKVGELVLGSGDSEKKVKPGETWSMIDKGNTYPLLIEEIFRKKDGTISIKFRGLDKTPYVAGKKWGEVFEGANKINE